jgi:hypothetical protein
MALEKTKPILLVELREIEELVTRWETSPLVTDRRQATPSAMLGVAETAEKLGERETARLLRTDAYHVAGDNAHDPALAWGIYGDYTSASRFFEAVEKFDAASRAERNGDHNAAKKLYDEGIAAEQHARALLGSKSFEEENVVEELNRAKLRGELH